MWGWSAWGHVDIDDTGCEAMFDSLQHCPGCCWSTLAQQQVAAGDYRARGGDRLPGGYLLEISLAWPLLLHGGSSADLRDILQTAGQIEDK